MDLNDDNGNVFRLINILTQMLILDFGISG